MKRPQPFTGISTMKKVITLSFIALLILHYKTSAQSTRLVLAEEFTQASCPPCAAQNPAFNTLLNANPTKVCAIKYHTSWPGVDPINAATQSMVGTRISYYNVSGVPLALMDGTLPTGPNYTGAPANWTQTKINTRAAVTSPYTLTVSHTVDVVNDSVHINGNILCTQAVSGTLVLHVALVEREIEFCTAPGTNGEKVFEGVMQLMIPNATGTSLAGSWTVGQQQAFNFNVAIPNYVYSEAELAVVAFVQNNATKEVLQSAFSAQQSLATDIILPCGAISNLPIVNCGAVTPNVTFKNDGTTNLTSADILYNVDGATSSTLPWTGVLAPGLTATVPLPALNPSAGSHVLNVSVVNNADQNVYRQTASQNFGVSSVPGSAPPLIQAFASATFPPAGWMISNPDNDITWTRNSAGLNGTGSAKMEFWNSPVGSIDELILSNINLSSAGQATIDFDVAYCQYSATTNDKIEVLYSVDCGQNWTTVFNQSGATLAAGNPFATSSWTPTFHTQWHHKTAVLQGAAGSNSVFVKFKATSAYGNNAYVDNINISFTPCVSLAFTGFPVNTMVNAPAGFCAANVNYTVTTNDPLAISSYVFTGATTGSGNGTGSGQLFKNGTTHVSVTVMNACSTLMNSFDITVVSVISDNNVCTVDACDADSGVVSHIAINTDDGIAFTEDGCDPATGVYHNPVFNVKLYLEGYYTGNGMMDNAGSGGTLFLLGLSPNQADVDTIELLFYDAHSLNDVLSAKGILQSNGTARISFGTLMTGNYYLHVRHRNTLETWSSAMISLATTNSYDFTDLQSKAYGSNQVLTSDQSHWAMFSGDVTNNTSVPGAQNGIIDFTDYSLLENHLKLISHGFIPTDISGDGVVESLDYLIMWNNFYASVMTIRP